MNDFWAGVAIAFQNFEAKYGTAVYILFFSFLLLILIVALVKTFRAGKRKGKRVNLRAVLSNYEIREHAADSLAHVIGFKTTAGKQGNIRNMLAFMTQTYKRVFAKAEVETVENGILYILRGKSPDKAPVLFCGHLDVVPAGKGWTFDAFTAQRINGKIYGRGANDGKGPIIAFLEAEERLLKEGFIPERDIYMAFGFDEETEGSGAENIAALLEQKGITFDLILDQGGYIAKKHMDNADYPAALIGVGERESCFFRLKAEASGGHSSMPGSVTAVGALSEAICRIEAVCDKLSVTPFAERFLKASLPAMSFKKRFVTANLPYTDRLLKWAFKNDPEAVAMMTSVLVPTQISGSAAPNMLANTAECVISAELLPGENAKDMFEFLKKLLSDLPIEVTLQGGGRAMNLTSVSDPMYKLVCETVRERFNGVPCIAYLASGCSNAKHYTKLGDCIIRFSPIVMEKVTALSAHGPYERISEESLAGASEVYERLLMKL